MPTRRADGRADKIGVLVTEVPSRRIDDILHERGESDCVVAVKMDIEGHEPLAVRGAERLFGMQRPLLMIEGANRSPDVVALMQGHGPLPCGARERPPRPATQNPRT